MLAGAQRTPTAAMDLYRRSRTGHTITQGAQGHSTSGSRYLHEDPQHANQESDILLVLSEAHLERVGHCLQGLVFTPQPAHIGNQLQGWGRRW